MKLKFSAFWASCFLLLASGLCAQLPETKQAIELRYQNAQGKKKEAVEQYYQFCEHFANSEYGSAIIAYANILRAIKATYCERIELRKLCKLDHTPPTGALIHAKSPPR